jgi:hypothetical protein
MMSFQHNKNSAPECIDAEDLCSADKLDRRSSLLTYCPENIEGSHLSESPPTLRMSPLRMKHSSPDVLVIRDSKGSVIAIGQLNGKQRATLFGARPLFLGQSPSLTISGRILYHLGHIVVSDYSSGTLYLLNSEVIAVHRTTCDSVELTRTAKVCQKINANHTNETVKKDAHPGYPGLTDDTMLTICMEAIFAKVFKR